MIDRRFLIVNADDLGMTTAVNTGIFLHLEAREGLLPPTTR